MTFERTVSDRQGAAPPATGFSFYGASNVGKVRSNNEDAFALDPQHGWCVVADGMGGLDRGEVASQTVVDTVRNAVGNGLDLAEGLRLAHRRIRELTGASASEERMGATAVAASVAPARLHLAWVGDSRAYRWRAGQLEQLTKDHSFVQELMDRGVISEREAANHPNRSVVTRAIGVREIEDLEVDEISVELLPQDRLLLCTDGLCGYLGDTAIAAALAAGGKDREVVERLIERTLADTEAADNLTVVLISVGN